MYRQVELAKRDFYETRETITPENRELLTCFKKAKSDIKRFGALRGETAQVLESVMDEDALAEFHQKLAKAGLPDPPEQGGPGSAPDQLSGATTHVDEALKRKVKIINEYLEPLQAACAEEDHALAVLEACRSLPSFDVLRNVLRYNASIDRRQAMLLMLFSELRGRAVSVDPGPTELPMCSE